jgi:intracellular sulfur oxidation DsrE/DsrF family protein
MKTGMMAILLGLGLALGGTAHAQAPTVGVANESPFVEHRLALQISDGSMETQTQVLNVAFNILKVYGPDKVAIEIVAFGYGIDLVHDGNPNAERISSVVKQGVTFDACNNTIEGIERKTGKPFAVNPQARRVISGAYQLMTLAEHGYTILRP